MSRPRLYRRASMIERLCRFLDCHPLTLAVLVVCCGYVGILMAWCVRHAATGVW